MHFWNNDKRTLKSHAAVNARNPEPVGASPERKKASSSTSASSAANASFAGVNPAARDAFPPQQGGVAVPNLPYSL